MIQDNEGTIIYFNDAGGYGFVRPADSASPDYFFHCTSLEPIETRVQRGDRVSFSTAPDARKHGRSKAVHVRLVERQVRNNSRRHVAGTNSQGEEHEET